MGTQIELFARLAASEVCPSCGASLTWQPSPDGQGVDLLHPQPPCAAFRQFVEDLVERHGKLKAERELAQSGGLCETTGKPWTDCYCEECKRELRRANR